MVGFLGFITLNTKEAPNQTSVICESGKLRSGLEGSDRSVLRGSSAGNGWICWGFCGVMLGHLELYEESIVYLS